MKTNCHDQGSDKCVSFWVLFVFIRSARILHMCVGCVNNRFLPRAPMRVGLPSLYTNCLLLLWICRNVLPDEMHVFCNITCNKMPINQFFRKKIPNEDFCLCTSDKKKAIPQNETHLSLPPWSRGEGGTLLLWVFPHLSGLAQWFNILSIFQKF